MLVTVFALGIVLGWICGYGTEGREFWRLHMRLSQLEEAAEAQECEDGGGI